MATKYQANQRRYHSLIFTSTGVTGYRWAVVDFNFAMGRPYDLVQDHHQYIKPTLKEFQAGVVRGDYSRMEKMECAEAYFDTFPSVHRNLLLISGTMRSRNTSKDRVFAQGAEHDATSMGSWSEWMFPSPLPPDITNYDPHDLIEQGEQFVIQNHGISHCLGEDIIEQCSVQFSWNIMAIVLAFNAAKLVAVGYMLIRFRREQLLVSVGDAIAFFLEQKDDATANMCLASLARLHGEWTLKKKEKLLEI